MATATRALMTETLGRYQLIKKLATGGMGQVFLARQKGPVGFEKYVVVKRILPHLAEDEDFIAMFFDEARIAALLNHPNIVQIYDLGEVDGTYFIAMEHVHGESLRAVNHRANLDRGGLPVALKCRIIADAAAALDFAHRATSPAGQPLGLIHRDVSPQNILVGFNGSVKLIDFGVAKAAGKISTTMTGAIKGKYAYMSPEQARGEALDRRSDVFGLGTVFYETLTSVRLFKRESELATMRAVAESKVPPPSTVAKGIPRALDAIVLKALAKRREDRFETAADLQLAIEDFLVRSRLPSTTAHLAAFMRDLYADEIRGDQRAVQAAEPLTSVKTPSRSRSSSKKLAEARAVRPGAPEGQAARREPSVSHHRGREHSQGSTRRARAMSPDPVELDLRLAQASPGDKVRGLLFNALLATVARRAGADAEPPVRAAAESAQRFADAASYATSDFLRVLWKSAETIAPACSGVERAFSELGSACMERLFSAGAVRPPDGRASDARLLLTPVLRALQSAFSPGERVIESSTPRSALLAFRGDLLPPPFQAGMLTRALAQLAPGEPEVTWEKKGIASVTHQLRW